LLVALAVGWEVAIRVAEAVQPSPARRELAWGAGTHQVFGAVAAAARLAGLRDEALISALGLAGISAPVPSAWTASGWVKDAVAWPASAGVTAALLAEAAYQGPLRILDGRRSYYASAGSDLYCPERITDGLGASWRLLGLSFKPYPACRWIHCALDLVAELVREHQIEAEDVERIEVAGIWELEHLFNRPEPADLVDAQFSLPYTIAQVLLRHPAGADWFREDRFADPLARALARKVSIRTDAEAERIRQAAPERLLTTVAIKTRDGRGWRVSGEQPRGGPDRPLSDADIEAKFFALADPAIGGAARAVAHWVRGLPDGSVGGLLERACRSSAGEMSE
jgi:2-methylcitrate dehydratase PrpD